MNEDVKWQQATNKTKAKVLLNYLNVEYITMSTCKLWQTRKWKYVEIDECLYSNGQDYKWIC